MDAPMTERTHLDDLLQLAHAMRRSINDHNLGLIAAGVAFYTMFSVFPGMAAVIAIWSLFSDPAVVREYLALVHGLIPDAAYEVVDGQMQALVNAPRAKLGWTTAVSLLVSLYSVRAAVQALIDGLNTVHIRGPRPGMARFLLSFAMTLALIGLILVALALVVLLPTLLAYLPLLPGEGLIIAGLPWMVLFLLVLVGIGMFYRFGPAKGARGHGWLTLGALVATVLWVAASVAFSLYLANFGSFNKVYGSIGAVIALLMWFYISAYAILLGALLNAEMAALEDQSAPQ